MSTLPSLDDRTYEQLLAEARGLVPMHAPEWSDHNPSDPGIAMLELFAWLAEMLIYRADQIPDRHRLAFVRLLRGPDWTPGREPVAETEIDAALVELRERWRAVTPEDYEALAPDAAPDRIALVHCVPRRDLAADPDEDAPGVVSVVVLPTLESEVQIDGDDQSARVVDAGTSLLIGASSPFAGVRVELEHPGADYDLSVAYHDKAQWRPFVPEDGTEGLTRDGTIAFAAPAGWVPWAESGTPRFWLKLYIAENSPPPGRVATVSRLTPVMPQPDAGLVTAVADHLEPRRILTVRPVVVGAAFAPVAFDVLVARTPDADPALLHTEIARRLEAFLDPYSGGPDGTGWPLGRSLYLGEFEELLDAVAGVEHVPDVLAVSPAPATALVHPDGDPIGLAIGANRLPDARVDVKRIVSGTKFISVYVALTVQAAADADTPALRAALKAAVRGFFHPLSGGPAGGAARDWPVADLEGRLRTVDKVARVTAELRTVPERMTRDSAGLPVLSLQEGELVDVSTEVSGV